MVGSRSTARGATVWTGIHSLLRADALHLAVRWGLPRRDAALLTAAVTGVLIGGLVTFVAGAVAGRVVPLLLDLPAGSVREALYCLTAVVLGLGLLVLAGGGLTSTGRLGLWRPPDAALLRAWEIPSASHLLARGLAPVIPQVVALNAFGAGMLTGLAADGAAAPLAPLAGVLTFGATLLGRASAQARAPRSDSGTLLPRRTALVAAVTAGAAAGACASWAADLVAAAGDDRETDVVFRALGAAADAALLAVVALAAAVTAVAVAGLARRWRSLGATLPLPLAGARAVPQPHASRGEAAPPTSRVVELAVVRGDRGGAAGTRMLSRLIVLAGVALLAAAPWWVGVLAGPGLDTVRSALGGTLLMAASLLTAVVHVVAGLPTQERGLRWAWEAGADARRLAIDLLAGMARTCSLPLVPAAIGFALLAGSPAAAAYALCTVLGAPVCAILGSLLDRGRVVHPDGTTDAGVVGGVGASLLLGAVLAPTAIGGWVGAAGSVAELLVLAAVAVFAVARSIE
jgi:hypothetical protein